MSKKKPNPSELPAPDKLVIPPPSAIIGPQTQPTAITATQTQQTTTVLEPPKQPSPGELAREDELRRMQSFISALYDWDGWPILLERDYQYLIVVRLKENDLIKTRDLTGQIIGKSAFMFASPVPWNGVPRVMRGPVPTPFFLADGKVLVMQTIERKKGPFGVPVVAVNMTQYTTEELRAGRPLPGVLSNLEVSQLAKAADYWLSERILGYAINVHEAYQDLLVVYEHARTQAIDIAHRWDALRGRTKNIGATKVSVPIGAIFKYAGLTLISLAGIYLLGRLFGAF